MDNSNLSPQNYQDDLDTTKPDPFANAYGDKPADDLLIPESELKDELDKIAIDEQGTDHEDARENIEDRDEDDDNAAASS